MPIANIPFYLHICSTCGESKMEGEVKVFGVSYDKDFVGKVNVEAEIIDDMLCFNIPEFQFKPQLGSAADIAAVKVRVCGDDVSIHAIYNDPIKTAMSACCHGGNCACYAAGCAC